MKVELNDFNTNTRHADAADALDEITVTLDNGQVFAVKSFNPHGFYKIHLAKGKVPPELTGSFTSADMAISEAKRVLEKLPAKAA